MARILLLTTLALFTSVATALAQDDDSFSGGPMVSASGSAKVSLQPQVMRMYVELTGTGKDIEAALESLEKNRERAVDLLIDLDADEETMKFEGPKVNDGDSNQRAQMEMMIRQRLAQGRKVPEGLKVSKEVTVSLSVIAEWPLPDDATKALLASHKLQKEIVDADLANTKEGSERSAEEEELAEEMAAMSNPYGNDEPAAGTPRFLYVATITDEARQQAMADAFADAKVHAGESAKAAGRELGELQRLTTTGGTFGGASQMSMSQLWQYQRYDQGSQSYPMAPNESVALELDEIDFSFNVQTAFGLE